jgi:hypothetical protein
MAILNFLSQNGVLSIITIITPAGLRRIIPHLRETQKMTRRRDV